MGGNQLQLWPGEALPAEGTLALGHRRSLQACEQKTERAALTESPVWTKAWRLEGACGLLPKLFPPCHGASLTFRNISDHLPDLLPLSQIRAQGQIPGFFRCPPPPLGRTGRGARRDTL